MIALALLVTAPLCATGSIHPEPTVSLPAVGQDPGRSGHDAEIALAREIGGVLEADRLGLATLTDELGLPASPGIDVGFGARIHRFRFSRGAGDLRLEVLTGTDEHGSHVVARLRFHFLSLPKTLSARPVSHPERAYSR